ncbi:MAG: hypothetical protein C5B50_03405 [Verrucomicrobia bacterium]|nr:MAG: hypothetical protein C5B50_03405 [Verrucomicrobiota bacterium]
MEGVVEEGRSSKSEFRIRNSEARSVWQENLAAGKADRKIRDTKMGMRNSLRNPNSEFRRSKSLAGKFSGKKI